MGRVGKGFWREPASSIKEKSLVEAAGPKPSSSPVSDEGQLDVKENDEGRLIEVAIALPVCETFTYREAAGCEGLAPGCRVLVPFGRRQVTGYVLSLDAALPPKGVPVKRIVSCLEPSPIIPAEVLRLCRWAAEYYLHPVGEVIRTALPPGINMGSERRAVLTDAGRGLVESSSTNDEGSKTSIDAETMALLRTVHQGAKLGVRIGTGKGAISSARARRLTKAGLVEIEARVEPSRIRARTVEYIEPTVTAESLDEALRILCRAPSQAALLEWLVLRGSVVADELRAAFPMGRPALRRLLERKMAESKRLPAGRSPGCAREQEVLAGDTRIDELTAAQTKALGSLVSSVGHGYSPFLLEGVTGSGKTEVYLRLIELGLERGLGALVLVPEIALTPQLAGRFRARFGDEVALLHSGLSEGERYDEWWRLRRGEARVAVGVRSAVFAPVRELGILVVDEEHDASFKQEEGLHYHARDLAMVRARQAGAVAVLGSATPSMESVENARRGRYGHLCLPGRVEGRSLPSIHTVDLRLERPRPMPEEASCAGANGQDENWLLSEKLAEALEETISSGKQAILFLNRRGHTPSLICESCGEPTRCKSCDVSLTFHRRPLRMLCHYCGFQCHPPEACLSCGGELRAVGVGTQRIEEEVRARLSGARVTRLDRDTTSRRGSLAALLADFALGRSDVLVGTQMVAKGHDFPGVTLVGVVLADMGLSIPDFRASERIFQLLSQVSGRAGRGVDPGRVLIQTWRPEQPPIAFSVEKDFEGFCAHELAARKAGRWPPFCRLLMVRVEGVDEKGVERTARRAAQRAEAVAIAHPDTEIEVLGPAPAPISLLRGRVRWQVLVKAPTATIVRWLGEVLSGVRREGGVDLTLDVDPVGML